MNARRLVSCTAVALVVGVVGAGAAQAATVTLTCGGSGAKSVDSDDAAHCSTPPKVKRTLVGTVRDDDGKPYAGDLQVATAEAELDDGSYDLDPVTTTARSDDDGSFSLPVGADYFTDVVVTLAASDDDHVAKDATAEAFVETRLTVTVRKLGGDRVRLHVDAVDPTHAVKLYVSDKFGYSVGAKPKSPDKHGDAIFSLRGRGTYYAGFDDHPSGGGFFPANRVRFVL